MFFKRYSEYDKNYIKNQKEKDVVKGRLQYLCFVKLTVITCKVKK